MSEVLKFMAAKSRPFVPFSVTIGGESWSLFARKPSLAEQAEISNLWDKVYQETKEKADSATIDYAPVFSQIKRLDEKKLARYIAQADRNDLRSEELSLYEGKSPDDPEIKAEVDSAVESRQHELESRPLDELRQMAVERRAHFYAMSQANEATSRATAKYIVYDGNKEPLFNTIDDAAELAIDDLSLLIEEASKVLVPKAVNPLDSPKIAPSDAPTPSLPESPA